jgi:hypothetical protein
MNNYVTLRLLGLLLALALASCGGECFVASMRIDPATSTADHGAPPPGNTQQFLAMGTFTGHCFFPADAQFVGMRDVIWSVSDTTNVSISNVADTTFGTATCLGPTSGAVTVTATLPANKNRGRSLVASGQITCN